jgi:DNA polymerase-3 subunit alpha
MAKAEFVHLHVHTDYSLLDGACSIPRLVDQAVEQKMPSVAITDHGNLFGAVKFAQAAEAKGVQPIIGCEVYITTGDRKDRSAGAARTHHLVLLSETQEGYKNLIKLVTAGHLEGFYYKPRIDKELLEKHSKGLIGLSACLNGEVAHNLVSEEYKTAKKAAGDYADIFGPNRFYLEMQDQGLEAEHRINPDIAKMSKELDLPLVVTNDCHYLTQADSHPHDALLCIQTGKLMSDENRMRFDTDQFYFKTAEEMMQVFRAMPEAVTRTMEIAERCNFQLPKEDNPFPNFIVPEGHTIDSYFEKVTKDGFEQRRRYLQGLASKGSLRTPLPVYEKRLEEELAIIKQMKFPGYFLIVWDFMRHAREQDIPVGPGRGSAAGSLVGYSLGITDIDPLQYGLLFERFLNPERVSLPDIDIDFCQRRRGEVINYVTEKYNRENVAQIITFGTMAAKAAIRDSARVMEIPYIEADKIAKMVPAQLNITLDEALKESPQLKKAYSTDKKIKDVIDVARRLEGLSRHASVHAAGVVISPRPLEEIVPLYKTNKDEVVTQFAMDDLEKVGLLKMDFLGLATLTVIEDTIKLIARHRDEALNLEEIPFDDAAVFEQFAQGLTSGIFQFESHGMREILRRYKPARFEDLIALNALYRPGPIQGGMIDDFIARKHGKREVTYILPELEDILEETLGVIVYQEQVMQIANRVAGFSLGEADLLRRAMGKKKVEVMDAQKEKFLAGARANKVNEKKAAKLFDLMAQFAGYGFNKSHSAAYALLAYQTAYLKTHYPVEFMAAVLTNETGNTDKIVKYIGECREMDITVRPPDIHTSHWDFTPEEGGIRFGLGAVRNVGQNTVEAIEEARERLGRFRSLYQFCDEVDARTLNRRALESLIKAGAMDSLGAHRAQLFEALETALAQGVRLQREKEDVEEWEEHERLVYEKEMLGYYISGHPLERYEGRFHAMGVTPLANLENKQTGDSVRLAGIVARVRSMRSRKGDRWAIAHLEDMSGAVDLLIFPKVFKEFERRFEKGAELAVRGKVRAEDSGVAVSVDRAVPLADAVKTLPEKAHGRQNGGVKRVVIDLDPETVSVEGIGQLQQALSRKPGASPVEFRLPAVYGRHEVDSEVRVNPDEELLQEIRALCGSRAVSLVS